VNFLTQLLPGFRSVRAPLIAGYLWLAFVWLLFREDLPREHEAAVYMRAGELGDLIGPVGLAVAASLAAYLIGSIVQLLLISLTDLFVIFKRHRFLENWAAALNEPVLLCDLGKPPLFRSADLFWFDGDDTTRDRLNNLIKARTAESRETLGHSVDVATGRIRHERADREGAGASDLVLALRPDAEAEIGFTVGAFVAREGDQEASRQITEHPDLPDFSASRDLFEEKATIKTRLMETTDQVGSEVERLYSEAELRVAIALPLFAVMVVFYTQTKDWVWLPLLLVPVGLLLQAMVLNKHGGRVMVEALRSRDDEQELGQITPAFRRYKEKAADLSTAIERFDWAVLVRDIDRLR
jgi:hypothetical protein